MKVLKTIAIIGLSAGIMSCASSKKVQLPVSLTGEWSIVSVDGKSVQSSESDRNPYIGFSSDNKIYGNSGCNRMMGTYTADTVNASLQFGPMASTRMMCPDMTTEQAVLAALEKVKGYQIEKGCDKADDPCALKLVDAEGNSLLIIEKKSADELSKLNGSWNIDTVNGEALRRDTGEPLYLDFNIADMRVSGKLGDNMMTGALIHNEGERFSISFGQAASTMMAGPNLALEDKVKSVLDKVTSFKLLSDSQVALLDADGNQVIILNKK